MSLLGPYFHASRAILYKSFTFVGHAECNFNASSFIGADSSSTSVLPRVACIIPYRRWNYFPSVGNGDNIHVP